MASRLVAQLIIECAKPIARCIQQGEKLPTLFGAFAGGALGACTAFAARVLLVPGILFGLTVGAALAAKLFKRKRATLPDQATNHEPLRLGSVVRAWPVKGFSLITGEFKSLTVLLESALYLVRDNDAPWPDVLDKLADAKYSELPAGDLIRLDAIDFFEAGLLAPTSISVHYTTAAGLQKCPMFFGRTDGADQLFAEIERLTGQALLREQCPVPLSRSVRAPLIFAASLTVLCVALAWASAEWTAHPPVRLVGRAEPRNPVVDLLIRVGPGAILLTGLAAALPFIAWLGVRAWRPPSVSVLRMPRLIR